jgi:hypothetical protein
MEFGKEPPSQDLILTALKTLFLQKGYPEESFQLKKELFFSYQGLSFELELPLVIEKEQTLLIVNYHPSKGGLSSFERPLLAIARIFFNPLPYFALLTNLQTFILIEVYPQITLRGDSELIPNYASLLKYTPPFFKSFKKEFEEKILALHLSGG